MLGILNSVHPSALIDPGATLSSGVVIGPHAIVGPGVILEAGVQLAPRAIIERNTHIGPGSSIGTGSIIGGRPQDLKYREEESWVKIGANVVIREYVTVNRGTAASGVTQIGNQAYLMSYVHVAHDCNIGEAVIIANGTQLAGHIVVEDGATISGLCALHQFVRIGRQSFIGGCSRVNQDIPPFVKAAGNPLVLYGVNGLGLRRAGMDEAVISALKHAYRLLFNSNLTRSEALSRLEQLATESTEIDQLITFLRNSNRGVPA